MTKIMFICHGNICRSPMAEFVFKDLLEKRGLQKEFYVASSATSREEIGNPVHYGTRKTLAEKGISCLGKTAVQFTKQDYRDFDYIILMDSLNYRNLMRIIGSDDENKVSYLLDYAGRAGESIADPWYTGNFTETYDDVLSGCMGLLEFFQKKKDKNK